MQIDGQTCAKLPKPVQAFVSHRNQSALRCGKFGYLFSYPLQNEIGEKIENGCAIVEHWFAFRMHTLSNYFRGKTSSRLFRTRTDHLSVDVGHHSLPLKQSPAVAGQMTFGNKKISPSAMLSAERQRRRWLEQAQRRYLRRVELQARHQAKDTKSCGKLDPRTIIQ